MQQPQAQPLHVFGPKSRRNNGLIFSAIIVVIGLVLAIQSGSPTLNLMMIAGLVGASYSWFSTPTQFLIYQNALVIKYGRPKVKVISLAEISLMEKVNLPQGEQLRVRLMNGKQVMAPTENIDEFRDRLEEARRRFTSEPFQPIVIDPGADRGPTDTGPGPAPY